MWITVRPRAENIVICTYYQEPPGCTTERATLYTRSEGPQFPIEKKPTMEKCLHHTLCCTLLHQSITAFFQRLQNYIFEYRQLFQIEPFLIPKLW